MFYSNTKEYIAECMYIFYVVFTMGVIALSSRTSVMFPQMFPLYFIYLTLFVESFKNLKLSCFCKV